MGDIHGETQQSFSFKRWKPKNDMGGTTTNLSLQPDIRQIQTSVPFVARHGVSGLTMVPSLPTISSSSDNGIANAMTRVHWQADGPDDICHEKNCNRTFGLLGRRHHCRRCGYIYCGSHLLHAMKLSAQASYDPENGMSVPVCRSCYKTTEKHMDHKGAIRDKSPHFFMERQRAIARLDQKSARIIWILDQIIANKNPQGLVDWAPDASTLTCGDCGEMFSMLRRRHHCRLCGQIYCSAKACSNYQTLDNGSCIRVCKRCTRIIKRDRYEKPVENVKLSSLYMALCLKRDELEEAMFDYRSRVAAALADEESDGSNADWSKDNMLTLFQEFQALAKTIEKLPTDSRATGRLQESIARSAQIFIQNNKIQYVRDMTSVIDDQTPT
eukprot:CFRG7800T1